MPPISPISSSRSDLMRWWGSSYCSPQVHYPLPPTAPSRTLDAGEVILALQPGDVDIPSPYIRIITSRHWLAITRCKPRHVDMPSSTLNVIMGGHVGTFILVQRLPSEHIVDPAKGTASNGTEHSYKQYVDRRDSIRPCLYLCKVWSFYTRLTSCIVRSANSSPSSPWIGCDKEFCDLWNEGVPVTAQLPNSLTKNTRLSSNTQSLVLFRGSVIELH